MNSNALRIESNSFPPHNVSFQNDLPKLIISTFADACIGETCSAVRMNFRSNKTRHSCLKKIFNQIGQDEENHAILGWLTVLWGLKELSSHDSYSFLIKSLKNLMPPVVDCQDENTDQHDVDFGLLSPSQESFLVSKSVQHIVQPTFEFLQGESCNNGSLSKFLSSRLHSVFEV